LRKTVSGITLILLLVSMLALAVYIRPVKADGTIYINANGSVSPSTAPIFTSDNVTYSFTDDINGSLQVDRTNTVLDGGGYELFDGELTLEADNVTVCNLEVIGWDVGIDVLSSHNIIRNNNITASNYTQNTSRGIYLQSLLPGFNVITQNRIENSSECITVCSSQNDISGNEISHGEIGIVFPVLNANGNRVFENNITDTNFGVQLVGDPLAAGFPYNNTFYHNNFINNTYQAADYSGRPNTFDDGYPSGGNYWSDYNGTDLYSGPYQNLTGSDGIGDTPYVIGSNNTDNYPLMNTWSPHDIAVTNVLPSKTIVCQGYGANVTVTAADLGDYAETFNLTVYVNTTIIASQNVTLSNQTSITLTFLWNTTGFAYDNYTISAYAWPVAGETNTANNNCTGGWVIVSLIGDLTGPNGWPDGLVDIRDVHYVAICYGTTPSSPNWNPNADINNDGKIDIKDAHIAAANYGQHYP
jgi:hypothetical protein